MDNPKEDPPETPADSPRIGWGPTYQEGGPRLERLLSVLFVLYGVLVLGYCVVRIIDLAQ